MRECAWYRLSTLNCHHYTTDFSQTRISTLNFPMKSAYELAMERLEKQSPTAQLTAAQKAEIAEIDATCKAKCAEQELFLKDKIAEAAAAGKGEEMEQLEKQLSRELRRFQEDAEAKKEKVRAGR
jgi:uncharacterized protein YecT (DUF1311 family)